MKIKFRAKTDVYGMEPRYVYGLLNCEYDSRAGCKEMVSWTIREADGRCYAIDVETIRQFVCYDADGTEVYEDDKIVAVDDEGNEMTLPFKVKIRSTVDELLTRPPEWFPLEYKFVKRKEAEA